jgi:hypothetical protein
MVVAADIPRTPVSSYPAKYKTSVLNNFPGG